MNSTKLFFAFVIVTAIFTCTGIAQVGDPSKVTAGVSGFSKLLDPNDIAGKYANTIREKDLEAHLNFLSNDLLEGRETCERGQKLAALYIESQFKRLDLKPAVPTDSGMSYFQSFKMRKYVLKGATASFSDKTTYQFKDHFISFDKGGFAQDLNAEMVYAGYGICDSKYDNYSDLDVKGKAVIVLPGEPVDGNGNFIISGSKTKSDWGGDNRSFKTKAAQDKGAAAIIFVLPTAVYNGMAQGNRMKHFLEGASYKMEKDIVQGETRVFMISEEMADELLKTRKLTLETAKAEANESAKVKALNLSKLRFKVHGDLTVENVSGENVLGFIEGTDLYKEVVVLTAHYDHIGVQNGVVYNGADDDGSGTAAVLEMAEAFSKALAEGHRPRRSILFMPVSGEEKGLLGSEYYSDNPVFPLENTVVDLNIDMIGRIDEKHEESENPFYVYIIGSDKLSSQLHEVNEKMNTDYTKLELDYTFNSPDDPNRFYYRSDHYNFAKNNIPVIFYFSGVHADYHQPTDDIAKIHFGKMMRTTKLVFLTAWEIANRDERLPVDKTSDFENK